MCQKSINVKVSANTASSVPKCYKNRTDHRVHEEGIQICQINSGSDSFQNMYSMNRQKLTVDDALLLMLKLRNVLMTI